MARPKKKPKKKQINVRMDTDMHELIMSDCAASERKPPAQIRWILRQYYQARLKRQSTD